MKRENWGCCCSVARLCWILWDPMVAANQAPLSLTISQSLLKFMSIELMMPSNHLIICYTPLLLPSILPSIRVFSNQMDKVLELQLQHRSSSDYSGLISFRFDWFDLLAVQGTLRSLLQHHNSKASILWCSAFFNGPTLISVHDY